MNEILRGDALELAQTLPDNSTHCIVTSPPYWGLRDYGTPGQLGLEETPEEYIEKLVTLFRELRRALHPSGCLWLNLGDSYSSGSSGQQDNGTSTMSGRNKGAELNGRKLPLDGMKPKNLIAIPWRVALALQADGWYLRSDIIWHKPNPMPESVTDRPTKAHEYIFLLTKSARYFYDAEAVREAQVKGAAGSTFTNGKTGVNGLGRVSDKPREDNPAGRNRRTVWTVATQPYAEAHFATFPPKLIEPCVLAGSSAKGVCPECGNPWERVVERESSFPVSERNGHPTRYGNTETMSAKGYGMPSIQTKTTTTGWRPTCDHDHEPIPATVLDPFIGSGTTAEVAIKHGRNWLGFELNAEYIELAHKRLSKVQLAFTI